METDQKPNGQSYDTFREKISTVDHEKGRRAWMYPKKQGGYYHNLRSIVTLILMGVLFGLPFLTKNGEPYFMFNIFERKFIFFGNMFWPQDTHLLLFGLLIFIVFIIIFTAAFGRVWCGWACPQTVFMEMVFRKVEYWIEGDANQQRKLNEGPWTSEKIYRKTLKHLAFFAIAVIVTHAIMANMIGYKQVWALVSAPPSDNMAAFGGMLFFSTLFYSIFAFLRELACIIICPYGRLQSVLMNKDSLTVSYDFVRGEPRGKLSKAKADEEENIAPAKGDCIDCKLCVQVCPTGIDIRNGVQMECVNCTLCMDACDNVMEKIKKPKGLIRLTSENAILNKGKFKFSARLMAYSGVLIILVGILGFLFINRREVETTFLRVPGMLYQKQPGGKITNLYNFQIINKSQNALTVVIKVSHPDGKVTIAGSDSILVPREGMADGVAIIEMPKSSLTKMQERYDIIVLDHKGKEIDRAKANFLGPVY